MIDPGKMRHRITFQKFDGVSDGYGDPLDADDAHWKDVVTTWAAIDPISGRERGHPQSPAPVPAGGHHRHADLLAGAQAEDPLGHRLGGAA